MPHLIPVATIKKIFAQARTIAIVGLSPKVERPSNMVARYLMNNGFRIIPVNPGQNEILGLTCYPDLKAIQEPVDVVDIFRRSDQVEPLVRQAIDIGAHTIWMQQGIINEQAAQLATEAGLTVIMDRCMKLDHEQFIA